MRATAVIIRSFNERELIGRCLEAVLAQNHPRFEVIVVDSGSTDGTVEIVTGFDGVRLVRIDPGEFSFGGALNIGIRSAATGTQDLVFLSAHAIPQRNDWLVRLTAPLGEGPSIAGAYGRQEPWPAHLENRIVRYLAAHGYRECYGDASFVSRSGGFFSNANAAIRSDCWDAVPFDETLTGGEDWLWARTMQDRGQGIAYVAEASVWHSHPDTAGQFLHRRRREERAMVRIEDTSAQRFGPGRYATALLRTLRRQGIELARQRSTLRDCLDAAAVEGLMATAMFMERRRIPRGDQRP